MGTIHIYADGGSRGNPGPAAVGVVLLDEKNRRIEEISRCLQYETLNFDTIVLIKNIYLFITDASRDNIVTISGHQMRGDIQRS